MTRGVLYIVWRGDCDPENVLRRSIASLKYWHPELEHCVQQMPRDSDLLCKARMYDLSPFDETLYLDADTIVMGKLDYGFRQAERHGLACCINANPWARRYRGLADAHDLIEYDTGVLFFHRKGDVERVFDDWQENSDIDSSCLFLATDGVKQMPLNDQCGFAVAMRERNPFVLPVNWNVHPRWQKTFFGPIKIWHDYNDVPDAIPHWNAAQSELGAVIKCGAMP